jgi:hypothetical protein
MAMAAALTACGKKGGGAGGDCAAAVDHMMTVSAGDMPKDMPADMKKAMNDMMAKAKVAVTKSCQDTKWSAEALNCIKAAKNGEEGKKCEEKLTKEQRDAAENAAEASTKDAAPVGGVKISDVDKQAAIRDITALKDEMCACKDAACGEAVYKKWGEVEKTSEHARHDEATKTQWEAIDDELMKCKTALK